MKTIFSILNKHFYLYMPNFQNCVLKWVSLVKKQDFWDRTVDIYKLFICYLFYLLLIIYQEQSFVFFGIYVAVVLGVFLFLFSSLQI